MRHLSLLLIALLHSGCAVDHGPLSLDVDQPDQIVGTYLAGETSVRFAISRYSSLHSTALWVDDRRVLEIDLNGELQRLSLHDGELVIDGRLGTVDPTIAGEVLAMRATETRRELVAIERTYEALELAGLDDTLLVPPSPTTSESRGLAPGEATFLWTSFGRGPRTFEIASTASTCAAVRFGSVPFGSGVALARGTQTLTRYGWSGLIAIENIGEWTAWDDPVCEAAPVTVRRVR